MIKIDINLPEYVLDVVLHHSVPPDISTL